MLRPLGGRMLPLTHSLLCAGLLGATIAAQCPPGAPMPLDLATRIATPAEGGPADVRWRAAKESLAGGRLDEARKHLLAALEFHPASPALLFDMVRACGQDLDLLALWCDRFVQAAADAQGRLRLEQAQRKLLTQAAGFEEIFAQSQRLAVLRAKTVAELAKFVERHKAAPKGSNARHGVLVRWAAEMLLATARYAPNPLASVAAAVDKTSAGIVAEPEAVIAGLLVVMRARPAKVEAGKVPATTPDEAAAILDRAIRAARILLGLQRQAGFKDLQGPAPKDLGDFAAEAQAVLRELADGSPPRVWTIAELEQLSPEAAAAFTAQHRWWRDPGVALSLTGKYRIETTCGHGTLLAAAQTLELHHARLAAHYDQDPFGQRQGLVRIVPESSDLETEGAPYWWAGGFQSGDRTTVRFAWDNIPSLGRTLTHELTHRFDGVLRPFLGSWYGEGHASWTGGHYGRMRDAQFVDDHLDSHTVSHTFYKGYGARENLEKLLKGEIEEYRDNYFAGYSLYAFLRGFPPKEPPRYREALGRFEQGARGGQKDPLGWFAKCFCDGKQGRSASFEAFLAEWQAFLRGCYERSQGEKKPENEWVDRYGGIEGGDGTTLVLDPPTWSWARTRAEPYFGQDHAAAATLLLHEAGDTAATIAAGLWSTTVDCWRLETARALCDALAKSKPGDAAQPFAAIARTRFPDLPDSGPSPHLPRLEQTRGFVDALAARSQVLAAGGSHVAAAALAAEQRELARRCGLVGLPASEHAPPGLPEHLAGHGLHEDSLTGFDDRRARGLWYATPDGDLHVGRERPRDGTGTVDRQAHQRDAFVRTVAWQEPGAYVLRGRVHFTTSYVSGAIVCGHSRRDRDLRLHFSAGDFRYAVGKSEQNEASDQLGLHLVGLWERDRNMPESDPQRSLPLPRGQAWFDYALHVRGPRVLVEINGEPAMRYAVHDGAPIEGHVGFAMSMGAIRVQQPTVQRLGESGAAATAGLDLARQPLVPLDDLLLLGTQGIPHAPGGTLVLWLPKVAEGSPAEWLPRALPSLARLLRATHEHPQTWVLCVPRELPAAERAAVQDQLQALRNVPMPVLEHAVGEPFAGNLPWVLFVDDLGVLRAAAEVGDPDLHSRVHTWSRLFRSR